MKNLLLAVLSVPLVALSVPAADAPADEAAKKEYARFAGNWHFVSMEADGKPLPEAFFKEDQMVLDGPKFTVTGGGTTYKGTFKVDVTKSPKQIDITFTAGPEAGKTLYGIYELEGDTYKVCLGMPGKDRPKAFMTKPDSGCVLEVLKRERAPKGKDERDKKPPRD